MRNPVQTQCSAGLQHPTHSPSPIGLNKQHHFYLYSDLEKNVVYSFCVLFVPHSVRAHGVSHHPKLTLGVTHS